MAEISKITLPSGITYELKDVTARELIAGGTTFMGVTSTALTDGGNTAKVTIGTEQKDAVNGGIVINGNKEFIYSTTDNKWHEIGDTTDLGALAYKDSATTTYKPAGTVSQPTFSGTGVNLKFAGTALSSTGKFTPAGSVSQPTFTGDEVNVSVSGTPTGDVSQPTFTGTSATITVS